MQRQRQYTIGYNIYIEAFAGRTHKQNSSVTPLLHWCVVKDATCLTTSDQSASIAL